MIFHKIAVGALAVVLILSTSALAQRQWQELAAKSLNEAEIGTPEYLLALLECTTAMFNHDKEQTLDYADQALAEAQRQGNETAQALCHMQRAMALAEMHGVRASQYDYDNGVALFDPDSPPELRMMYYSFQFNRDRLVKDPQELLPIGQLFRDAIDESNNTRLKLIGEFNLLEIMSIASPPEPQVFEELRERSRHEGLDFLVLALDGREALLQPASDDKVTALAGIAERAQQADFRQLHIIATFRLLDDALENQKVEDIKRYSQQLYASAKRLKRADWLGLSLAVKSDLARRNADADLAVTHVEAARELLPFIDLGAARHQIQQSVVEAYLAAEEYDRLKEFTDEVFAQAGYIESQKLEQRLLEFSRNLHSANEEKQQTEQELQELESQFEEMGTLVGELDTENKQFKSAKDRFQRLSTVGFVLASALATIVFVSRWRLRKTHNALRAQVAENQRNQEIRQALEAKVAQVQRMESLGALAGGVAHDFNNLLVGVLCNAEMLDKHQCDQQMKDECLSGIIHSALAAADLSQKMLSYAGKVPNVKKRIELNELMGSLSPLLKSGLNLSHTLDLCFQELYAEVDGTQMEQVAINLVTNAAAAVKGVQDGKVTIRTGVECIGDVASDPTILGTRDTGGEFVFVEVQDNGTGIEPDKIARIFEPFYSANANGRGLGLAVVYGHVVGHDGLIRCVSSPGYGTTIRVLIPRVPAPEWSAHQVEQDAEAPVSGAASVLVIDDEPSILSVMKRTLTAEGWRVVTFDNGFDAIDHLDNTNQHYDCLIIDVRMPEMDGKEVLKQLEQRRCDLPVVMMSGFTTGSLKDFKQHPLVSNVLEKPFTPRQLISATASEVFQRV